LGDGARRVGSSFLQSPEGVLHVLHQLGELRFDLNLAVLHGVLDNDRENTSLIRAGLGTRGGEDEGRSYHELQGADLVQDLAQVLLDHRPGDLVVALRRGLHRVAGQVVEGDHVREDADGFVEGAEPECVGTGGGGEIKDYGTIEWTTFSFLISSQRKITLMS